MSVDFRFRDFAYPLSILRLRSFLERSQWFSQEQLRAYQNARLSTVLRHAYQHVPYYRRLFNAAGVRPEDIQTVDDLPRIPVLTKSAVRQSFAPLTADNALRFGPRACCTSGTSGEPMRFCLDKSAHVLEFCYYWRHWSWAGYRLGNSCAQFSIHHFMDRDTDAVSDYSPLTRMLVLNSLQLSIENIRAYVDAIKKHKPRFLKGAPTTLHMFSQLLGSASVDDLAFEGIFTTGEMLLPHQRSLIEQTLHGPVLDSFGHMERTVAISQCLKGNYHVHSEYGILEVVDQAEPSEHGTVTGRMVGTALHNFAMPFIRYELGDVVEIDPDQARCPCGRGLPVVKGIHGREQDVVVTSDGRYLTNLFVIFQGWEGVDWYQFIQEDADHFTLLLVTGRAWDESLLAERVDHLKDILGPDADIDVRMMAADDIPTSPSKYRPVVSRLTLPSQS